MACFERGSEVVKGIGVLLAERITCAGDARRVDA
jgi:hypothetical protein